MLARFVAIAAIGLLLQACKPDDGKKKVRVLNGEAVSAAAVAHEHGEARKLGRIVYTRDGKRFEYNNATFALMGDECKPIQILFGGSAPDTRSPAEKSRIPKPGELTYNPSFSCSLNWDEGALGVGTYAEPFSGNGLHAGCNFNTNGTDGFESHWGDTEDFVISIDSLSSERLAARFHGTMQNANRETFFVDGNIDATRGDDSIGQPCKTPAKAP